MYKEISIIDQKLDELAEKWMDATDIASGRIICIHAEDDEEEMADAFFQYLLSPDAVPNDIAFYFESVLEEVESFSESLLKELEQMIFEWNHSEKEEGIAFIPVEWSPDFNLTDKNNPAFLFIANINRLARSLQLERGVFVTPVLKFYSQDEKAIQIWLEYALKAGISDEVRLAVSDTVSDPVFEKLSSRFPDQVLTIIPKLDMENVMAQLAAMGDPQDPATPYRYALTRLMEAIKKKKKREIEEYAKTCIEIATENIDRNPYWIMQLVGVYNILSMYRLDQKDNKGALRFADRAVETSGCGKDQLEAAVYFRQLGQALLYRGSLLCVEKEWKKAIADFKASEEAYAACKDYILQVESLRMEGYAMKKTWQDDASVPLAKGARLGQFIPPGLVDASSYAFLIRQLLKSDYKSEISNEELDKLLVPIWGDSWREYVDRATSTPLVEEETEMAVQR